MSRRSRRLRRPQIALIALVAALALGYAINAVRGEHHTGLQSGTVALSSLPAQASDTVHLIEARGPFPYPQDGVVFNNAERRLPDEPRGYYREYTVPTPGSADRGARRIITGKNGEYYYTSDHYETFRRVDVTR
ncbi:MAG TPA: ribonuclease domain-containing protein [Jatrophihabitantaceae bacterium]